MFKYKYKKGEVLQIIKPSYITRWVFLVSDRKIKTLENRIWWNKFYEGYAIELRKNKEGIYIPNENAEIYWYKKIKQDHLFPLDHPQKKSKYFSKYIELMKILEPPISKTLPPFESKIY